MKRSLLGVLCGLLVIFGAGCASNPEIVRSKMLAYTEQGLYAEARAVEVKHNPGGISRTAEENVKDELIRDTINPAEIASRVKALKTQVQKQIKAGDYAAARKAIRTFGVAGIPEVDNAVYAVKLALLNSLVNPADWDKMSKEAILAVKTALAKDDFKAAGEAIDKLVWVSAYDISIDDKLKDAAKAAIEQSITRLAADKVIAAAQKNLYDKISPRPDDIDDDELLEAYFIAVESMTDYVYKPDWARVQEALDAAAAGLVADDMSQEDADAFADDVLSDFKGFFNRTKKERLPTLTTHDMNEKISNLKMDLSSLVSKALDAKLKAAALAAEKAAAEAEAQKNAAAEAAAKKAAAEEKKLQALALNAAARAAGDIDFDTRINAFVDAISDRVEPDVNRVLGDGARILRLLRSGTPIGKKDAASLLVAATYMGFDDVMHLALILGADVNGSSPKDNLKRAPLLIASQYGYKGHAAEILASAKASLAVRDANGRGAVHYAVLGANNSALLLLLRSAVDARTPDKDGVTPFILAADQGYSAIVRMLVPFSDMEARDKDGFTALLRAAEHGRVDLVRMLIDTGANARHLANNKDGLIELAAAVNAPELLVYLLDEKKYPPTERCTAQLVIAGNVPTLQQMVAHGAKLGDKHLAVAVKLGDFPMVKYLVSLGMDVNADCVRKASVSQDGEIKAFLYAQGQRVK